MGSRGWTSVLACVAAVVAVAAALFGVGVSSAPAGNRAPDVQLIAFPGPSTVTYLQNVAYTSTLTNTQSSTFTHVLFHDPIPTTLVNGTPIPAVFKYASCSGQLTATEFVCDEISQLAASATVKVTIVWQTPAAGSSSGCPAATPVCMTNAIAWTMKEGTGNPGSAGPDTFPAGPVSTSLLVVPDARKAGGYALGTCSGTGTTLGTNAAVNASNPLATKVCASTLPTGDVFNPGLVVAINERNHTAADAGFTQVSEICIPQPGDSCDSLTGFTPWVFSPPATFTFVFDNTTLPKGVKITTIFHDDVAVPCAITVDSKTKTTTAVCSSSTNGRWTGG